ncbi:MAG: tripartite tricarboxylate transporter permease, partial [Syntrophales bacterium]|nr:tripartite tricarboxylate transporter permease [Syntrophales bacterium]
PLFALGIPFTPAMALVLGALMLHGLTPGPNLIKDKPDLFWAVIASMYIGNFMLIVLNLPLVNVFVNILRVPQRILMPVIVLVCLIGVYSVNASLLDLLLLSIFGFAGYILRGSGFQAAPLILALVIGPMLETSLRQALNISGGDLWSVLIHPISVALYTLTILTFAVPPLLHKIKFLWGH